jgi:hypothetical protein
MVHRAEHHTPPENTEPKKRKKWWKLYGEDKPLFEKLVKETIEPDITEKKLDKVIEETKVIKETPTVPQDRGIHYPVVENKNK